MNNKVDYLLHQTYNTPYYHRQYDNDLKEDKTSQSYSNFAKRVALTSLPFLSLYQPFGKAINFTMGSARVVTNGVGVVTSENWKRVAIQTAELGLALVALVGVFYHFTLGLYLTTLADVAINLFHICENTYSGDVEHLIEQLLQALGSTLYLGIMLTGSLEVVILSLVIQSMISFYQASEEWKDGRIPEAVAKTLMGMIRTFQAHQQFEVLQTRNVLRAKYKEFTESLQKGRKIDHLWDHPLIAYVAEMQDLPEGEIASQSYTFSDANGQVHDFGSHFFGLGKDQVKGMNVTFRKENGHVTLEFKVNHVARDQLEKRIQVLKKMPKEDMENLLKIYGSHAKDIQFGAETKNTANWWWDLGDGKHEIKFGGLGEIRVGSSKDNVTLYDRVTLEMNSGTNLYQFHEVLSFLKLDDALRQSAKEDFDRMKLGHLYRIFCPRDATPFERTGEFFNLPFEQLKERIISRSPAMKGIIDKWWYQMELREILPGRMRFAADGLANELQENGVRGFTAAIFGGGWWGSNQKELCDRTISILESGMISHEMRDRDGFGNNGLSGGADYYTGGADSVFTQMVTDRKNSYSESMYRSPIRILLSPKIAEMGSYQYHCDNFGTRKMNDGWSLWGESYKDRHNIFEFTEEERRWQRWDHEVMFKERIPPEYITGILVQDDHTKNQLIEEMRKKEIIKLDEMGRETIFSKLIDQFIHIGSHVRDEHFA